MGYQLPDLKETEKRVLGVLLDSSNISGDELASIMREPPAEVMAAVATLRKYDLIQVVGSSATESGFMRSRFAVLPAAKSIAGMLAR